MKKVFEIHAHTCLWEPFALTVSQMRDIFLQEMEWTGTDKICILGITHHGYNDGSILTDLTQNVKNLFLKYSMGEKAYAFASLVHPFNETDKSKWSNCLLEQAKEFHKVGFDGVKMLEGYPSLRKIMGFELCDEIYDEYYKYMEDNQIPIIMHVANPEENWDITKASEYAIKAGRVYDNTFPTKRQLQDEVFKIMQKFPKLRLTLAHMGFMSKNIQDARDFLSYPNTMLDITPGGEQLIQISKDWDIWKGFFEEYQDRILYGSDYYPFPAYTEAERRIGIGRRTNLIRQMFETDEEHYYFDEKFKGVKLDEKILDKIYNLNNEKYIGERKEVSVEYLKKSANELKDLTENVAEYCKEDMEYILNNV